jgi:hypothetical protein
LGEGHTLARIGGNEFITVMVDLEKAQDSVPILTKCAEVILVQPLEGCNSAQSAHCVLQ